MARLHHFVEVADRSGAHRTGQRPVGPHDVTARHDESPDQIGAGEIVVAADGDQ